MPFAPIEDGQLYYEEHGQGPSVLLVSGLGGTASYWNAQIEALSQHYHLIVHDHRGTGQSTRSEITYSVDQMSADTIALMDHLGLERAHLVGHSTGGAIGQTLAITAPQRIESMVLYATWTKTDAFMGRLMRARKALLQNGIDDYIELSPALLYPDWWVNSNPEKLAALDKAAKAGFSSASIAGSRCQAVIDFDRSNELDRITQPTCVLCARDDFLTPLYFSEDIAQKIPGAQLKVLEKGGHAVSQVDPDGFNAAVLEFLHSVTSTPASS